MRLKNYLERVEQMELHSVADVRRILDEMDPLISDSELPALKHFNKAYLRITAAVEKRLGSFDHPDFLNKFDVFFVRYYLRALYDYLNGRPVPPAWQRTFDYCRHENVRNFRALALGVNAHVNNDIPQALADSGFKPLYKKDYFMVNRIIDSTVNEVLGDLEVRHSLSRLYYRSGMHLTIRLWRRNSWLKAGRLLSKTISVPRIERRAGWVSQAATRFPLV